MEFKHIPIHRGLTRQQLLAGCDRELFFLLLMLSGLLFMSGFLTIYIRNMVGGIVLWMIGTPILAKLANYDPYFRGIVMRSLRFLKPVLPANGKVGLPPIKHKRWD